MEIINSIGERLLAVRENMHKTQSDFADIAASAGVPGATRQSQAKYEKGLATPSAAYLAAIAAAGADVLYILTGVSTKGHALIALQERAAALIPEGMTEFEPIKAHLQREVAAMQAGLAGPALTAEEQTLLSYFRKASREVRRAALGALLGAAEGGAHQTFNATVRGGVAGRDIVKSGGKK